MRKLVLDAFYCPPGVGAAQWGAASEAQRRRLMEGEYQRLASENRRLVFKVHDSVRHIDGIRRLGMESAIADGMLGLVAAARKFDPSLGNQFSTYAWHAIKHAMIEAARRTWLIANPCYEQQKTPPCKKTIALAIQARRVLTLKGPRHRNTEENAEDRIGFEENKDAFFDTQDAKMLARRALDYLNSRWRQAITLCVMQDMTYQSASAVLGVTKQRVQQMVRAGILKMRAALESLGVANPCEE